jgi:PhnB protein
MISKIEPIPDKAHNLTPFLVVDNAPQALDYYQKAFGAEVMFRMDKPNGKVMHAAIKIGQTMIMLADECDPHPGHESCCKAPTALGGTTVQLYLYVQDVDSVFKQAVTAGGKVQTAVENMFWGDRMGVLLDPFGHSWAVASRVQELSEEEMRTRAQDFMAQMSG